VVPGGAGNVQSYSHLQQQLTHQQQQQLALQQQQQQQAAINRRVMGVGVGTLSAPPPAMRGPGMLGGVNGQMMSGLAPGFANAQAIQQQAAQHQAAAAMQHQQQLQQLQQNQALAQAQQASRIQQMRFAQVPDAAAYAGIVHAPPQRMQIIQPSLQAQQLQQQQLQQQQQQQQQQPPPGNTGASGSV
jgi:hypothetical protein